MFKWPNKYADVFITMIDLDKEEVQYTVRDKDTGILVEPSKKSKFIVSASNGMVYFDARECPINLFQHIHNVLQS